jgi:hypothetical protein
LPISGKIFFGVVNDMVCAKGMHHRNIPRTAHASYFSPERFGNLHCKATDTSGGTIDQYILPCLNLPCVSKSSKGDHSGLNHRRRFFERSIDRFQGYCFFWNTHVLGKGAIAAPSQIPVYLIIWLKLLDVSTHRFNMPRYVIPRSLTFWPKESDAH